MVPCHLLTRPHNARSCSLQAQDGIAKQQIQGFRSARMSSSPNGQLAYQHLTADSRRRSCPASCLAAAPASLLCTQGSIELMSPVLSLLLQVFKVAYNIGPAGQTVVYGAGSAVHTAAPSAGDKPAQRNCSGAVPPTAAHLTGSHPTASALWRGMQI